MRIKQLEKENATITDLKASIGKLEIENASMNDLKATIHSMEREHKTMNDLIIILETENASLNSTVQLLYEQIIKVSNNHCNTKKAFETAKQNKSMVAACEQCSNMRTVLKRTFTEDQIEMIR